MTGTRDLLRSETVNDLVLLVSRQLLAWIFLHEGVFLATNFAAASTAMGKLGVPALLLAGTIALQLAGGAAIAVGLYSRLGATASGLFCLATAILFHRHFAIRNEMLHFEKDLAIAGGLFLLAARGPGRWSISALLGRKTSIIPDPQQRVAVLKVPHG